MTCYLEKEANNYSRKHFNKFYDIIKKFTGNETNLLTRDECGDIYRVTKSCSRECSSKIIYNLLSSK